MWFRMSFHIGRQGRVILHPLRIRRGVHLAYGIPELSMGRRRIARKALPSARRPDGEICSASHKWHMCTNDMREDGIFRTSDCISNIHQA